MIAVFSISYLLILFGIAYWGEKAAKSGKSIINNAYIYALSLTVYCTAWTYYGSVGRAAHNGLDFLTIYIGPTLAMPIWWIAMKKIIRICKFKYITSIADFISSRYGKSRQLGVLVTLVCLTVIVPYIALQLKAVAINFTVLTTEVELTELSPEPSFLQDTAFYITLILVLFTILFGTRNIEATERHEGMVAAIAFESIIKLLAFVILGIYVTYGLFDGFGDIFSRLEKVMDTEQLYTMPNSYSMYRWLSMCVLSMLAFMFLPRQFQVAVIENTNRKHLNKAVWIFPLYIFIINIFVIPIAFGGMLLFKDSIDADTYVLLIPLEQGQTLLTLFVYIGGFSAATSMIIVSTTALSVMMSNNLIMPILVSIPFLKKQYRDRLGKLLLFIRRLSILLILHIAYAYYRIIVNDIALVSIGLISFVGISQFAPAILGGIYWKKSNRLGATWGIVAGVVVWFYTLVLPTFVEASLMSEYVMLEGLGGISWLRPQALFGLESLDSVSHALFWSLFFNVSIFILFSFIYAQNSLETNEAEVFVNIHKYSESQDNVKAWKGVAYIQDLTRLLSDFLGKERTEKALQEFSETYGRNWQFQPEADANLVTFSERLLAGTIGVAAARTVIASVVKDEEEIRLEEVYGILKESQQLIQLNHVLEEKSMALEKAKTQLQSANERLKFADQQKNEFIFTITHELRTPITAIRAFSEILHDNDDLELDEKQQFLSTIIKETNRMERLISQVLELEKFDSGTHKLQLRPLLVNDIIQEATKAMNQVLQENNIVINLQLAPDLPPVQGEADRLMQVVLNLISNAIKFCKKENGQISVFSVHKNNHIEVSVLDNGRGIKKEIQELIFDKFFQAKDQNIRKPKGSGLGLAISKKIINYHGGEIWVESELNQYSKFTFTLPLTQKKDLSPSYE